MGQRTDRDLEATRSSLLERLRDLEDREGWNEFFETYWRLIYGVARRTGMTEEEAMDVVQETMISVSREIGGFVYDRRRGRFRGWLGTLTRRRVADFFRAQVRQQGRREEDFEGWQDWESPELERIWQEEWEHNLIEMALGRIRPRVSERNFQVFHCHVIQDWSVVKVCRELGVNPGAVYLVKHRVGAIFKEALEGLRAEE